MTEGVQKTISYFSTTQHSASDHFLPDKAFQNARRTFLKTLSKKISLITGKATGIFLFLIQNLPTKTFCLKYLPDWQRSRAPLVYWPEKDNSYHLPKSRRFHLRWGRGCVRRCLWMTLALLPASKSEDFSGKADWSNRRDRAGRNFLFRSRKRGRRCEGRTCSIGRPPSDQYWKKNYGFCSN